MTLFSIEHSRRAYQADFALYGAATVALAVTLLVAAPPAQQLEMAALATTGVAAWTLLEYLLHRFVLHGLRPFSDWHGEHHHRPTALICAPTVLSASLIVLLVFAPALWWGGLWRACAITFGVLGGYLAYAVTHHATHHWQAGSTWLRQRKRWHALHHSAALPPGHYGVTTSFWDHLLGSQTSSTNPFSKPKAKP